MYQRIFPTIWKKWWKFLFLLYSLGLLYFSDDNNSHHNFPSAPLEAARLIDKQEGLRRHFKAQSRLSYTVDVPTLVLGDTKCWILQRERYWNIICYNKFKGKTKQNKKNRSSQVQTLVDNNAIDQFRYLKIRTRLCRFKGNKRNDVISKITNEQHIS